MYNIKVIMKLRFPLTTILFWVVSVLIVVFCENITLSIPGASNVYSNREFLVYFIILFILICGYFFLERKYNKISFNYIVVISLFALFAISVMMIILQPELTSYTGTSKDGVVTTVLIKITTYQRLRYIVISFLTFLVAYLFFVVLPKKWIFFRQLNWVYVVFIIVTLLTVLYSYIMEAPQYISIFTGFDRPRGIKAWFSHPNVYGLMLMLGVFASLYLSSQKPRLILHVLTFFFLFNISLTFSLTSLVICSLVVLIYYVFRFFLTLKSHPKLNISIFLILSGILILGIGVFVFLYCHNVSIVEKIVQLIYDGFIKSGYSTLESRIVLWKNTLSILLESPFYLIFGRGIGVFQTLLDGVNASQLNEIVTTHNGFVEVMGNGGIISLCIYLISIFIPIVMTIKMMRKGYKSVGFTCLLLVGGALVASCLETFNFFKPTTLSLALTIMFLLPFMSMNCARKEKEVLIDDIKTNDYSLKSSFGVNEYFSLARAISFLLVALMMVGVFFVPHIFKSANSIILVILSALVMFFALPNIIMSFLIYLKKVPSNERVKRYIFLFGEILTFLIVPLIFTFIGHAIGLFISSLVLAFFFNIFNKQITGRFISNKDYIIGLFKTSLWIPLLIAVALFIVLCFTIGAHTPLLFMLNGLLTIVVYFVLVFIPFKFQKKTYASLKESIIFLNEHMYNSFQKRTTKTAFYKEMRR